MTRPWTDSDSLQPSASRLNASKPPRTMARCARVAFLYLCRGNPCGEGLRQSVDGECARSKLSEGYEPDAQHRGSGISLSSAELVRGWDSTQMPEARDLSGGEGNKSVSLNSCLFRFRDYGERPYQ